MEPPKTNIFFFNWSKYLSLKKITIQNNTSTYSFWPWETTDPFLDQTSWRHPNISCSCLQSDKYSAGCNRPSGVRRPSQAHCSSGWSPVCCQIGRLALSGRCSGRLLSGTLWDWCSRYCSFLSVPNCAGLLFGNFQVFGISGFRCSGLVSHICFIVKNILTFI